MMIDKELNAYVDDLYEVDFLLKSYPSIDYINELLEVIEFDSNIKPKLVDFVKNYNFWLKYIAISLSPFLFLISLT